MKNYAFKEWKNGYCLYLCALSVGEYFEKPVLLNPLELGLDDLHWTWPATAALGLADAGLSVTLFDTDISYIDFEKNPQGWILQKYGQSGIDHINSHFNFNKIVSDSKQAVRNNNIKFENKTLSFSEIRTLADDPQSSIILCLNYATIYGTSKKRMGHYFLVKGSSEDAIIVTEPYRTEDTVITRKLFEKSEADLDNEVQHFIIKDESLGQAKAPS